MASSPAFLAPSSAVFGPPAAPTSSSAASRAPSGSSAQPLSAAAALAAFSALGAAVAQQRRRTKWAGHRPSATQRHFFGNVLETMNPFYESPDKQTAKQYQPTVDAINALEPAMKARSDEELRALTEELQKKAQSGTSLDDLLPEAFALVREGSRRVLGLRHFDVQLMGGMALHQGNIAEMGTGEGKTLVAILAAFLNALNGKGVHVVTVNDYLARRDAEWVGQPLRFLGMTVGIVQGGMESDQKRKAYRSDVTYVTNSELGFDYLRDQMAATPQDLCLREQEPFTFAIVDEVDSILIDEARTPLIISGTASTPSSKYLIAKEVVKTLRKTVHYSVDEKQRQCILIEEGVEAAEKLLGKDDLFDPQDPWYPYISNALNAKELYVKDKQYIVKKGEVMIVDEFTGRVMDGRRWSNGLHQAIEAKENVKIQSESVTLASISYQSLFLLFKKLGGMTGTAFTEAKEFEEIYKLKTVVIPPNRQRRRTDKDDQVYVDDIGKWKAVAKEIDNAHRIGRPCLIGTTNVENSEIIAELLDALDVRYQLLNAKPENVARETEIVANSGRKYAVTIATNMAGRGTDILLGGNSAMMARLKLREELYSRLFPKKIKIWKMPEDFYPIDLMPTTREKVKKVIDEVVAAWAPEVKQLKPDTLEKAAEIVEAEISELEIEEKFSLACEKQPTDDELLLKLRDVYNQVAAEYKGITDLEKEEVIALGGLYVIGTERHESRRIDNQLRGRCARQGDQGSTRFFLSLNDSIFRIFGGDSVKKMMGMMNFTEPDDVPLESGLLSGSLEEAQKKVENYYYSVRKNVFEYDSVMDTQRKIVYDLRRRALLDTDDSIKNTMLEFSDRNMEDFVLGHTNVEKPVAEWLLETLAQNVGVYCESLKEAVTKEKLEELASTGGVAGQKAVQAYLQSIARSVFEKKCASIEETGKGLSGIIMRRVLLMQLDTFWQQHLKNMDFMKTGVTLRAYGQKNPLTEYKLEGYQVFLKMMSRIRRNAVYNVLLFLPRKLKPMSKDRIKELVGNRETRRAQAKELAKELGTASLSPAEQTLNLARLALTVRQLLKARKSLQELALASFSELQVNFFRAGLMTNQDQLRWANACADFELYEDEVAEEVYICMKGAMDELPDGPETSSKVSVDAAEVTLDPEALAAEQAREAFRKALEDREFLQSMEGYQARPEEFLAKLKESTKGQGWSKEDVAEMRKMYKAVGIDIDEMLQQMNESSADLPAEQREVVEYMTKLLNQPEQVTAEQR